MNRAIALAMSSGAGVYFGFCPADGSSVVPEAKVNITEWLANYENMITTNFGFDGIIGNAIEKPLGAIVTAEELCCVRKICCHSGLKNVCTANGYDRSYEHRMNTGVLNYGCLAERLSGEYILIGCTCVISGALAVFYSVNGLPYVNSKYLIGIVCGVTYEKLVGYRILCREPCESAKRNSCEKAECNNTFLLLMLSFIAYISFHKYIYVFLFQKIEIRFENQITPRGDLQRMLQMRLPRLQIPQPELPE